MPKLQSLPMTSSSHGKSSLRITTTPLRPIEFSHLLTGPLGSSLPAFHLSIKTSQPRPQTTQLLLPMITSNSPANHLPTTTQSLTITTATSRSSSWKDSQSKKTILHSIFLRRSTQTTTLPQLSIQSANKDGSLLASEPDMHLCSSKPTHSFLFKEE